MLEYHHLEPLMKEETNRGQWHHTKHTCIPTLETLYRLTEHFNSNRQTSKILWVWFQTTAINRVMQFLWFPGAHASYVYTIL